MNIATGITITSLLLALCSLLVAVLVLWATYGCWAFEWDDNPPRRVYTYESQ